MGMGSFPPAPGGPGGEVILSRPPGNKPPAFFDSCLNRHRVSGNCPRRMCDDEALPSTPGEDLSRFDSAAGSPDRGLALHAGPLEPLRADLALDGAGGDRAGSAGTRSRSEEPGRAG